MQNRKHELLSHLDELPSRLYVLLGVFSLALHILLCAYTNASPTVSGLIILLLYALCSAAIFLFCRRKMYLYRTASDAADEQNEGVIAAFRDEVHLPYAVVTENGRIVTVNAAMREAIQKKENFFNTNISDLCSFSMEELQAHILHVDAESIEDAEDADLSATPKAFLTELGNSSYEVNCYPIRSRGHLYYMLTFTDVTELQEITALHHATTPAVAYILLDNLDEIAQYVQGSYRAEAVQADNILKAFASEMGGVLREYDRNRYVLFFTRKMLEKCIENKFEILDDIRAIRFGDDAIPLTVSIGIAITGNSLAEREHDALASLDMAIQRGGDQVVLKNESGVYYFGGKTKSQQKRTRGRSRIIASKLCGMISSASNVLIMGHSNPDFDSIGACVGIASLAMHLGADVKIVTDKRNENFLSCTEKLLELDEYRNIFVDGVEGLSACSYSTLVIIVDANNFRILEAPEIANKAFRTAVIDHHIKKEEFEQEPALSYIDPSASSACELITEILEQALPAGTLKSEEANVMLAGIMVDTKNFTRTVGTRTFAAALYLRSTGANTEVARTYFNEAFEDYRSEALFGAAVEMYRDQIAITVSSGTGSPHDRIAAAKTSDKLLTIRNVNAAFALVRIGEVIHISARSNGKINVQLILEKIGGGGHFDMAGAAVSGHTPKEVKQMLLDAIDDYFEPNKKQAKSE